MNKMYKTKQTVQTNKVMKAFFVRYLMILALLLGVAGTAGAQAVIMNGNYFLTHNEAGTTVNTAATTTFNPATCLWAYASRDYIRTNVTVNVHGSNPGETISEVFGGCNLGGNIKGKIEVNIDSNRSDCPLHVDYVYGGSNMAAYTPDAGYFTGDVISPVVHVKHGTVNEEVFGGGYGNPAVVTANPMVIVGNNGADSLSYHVRVGSATGVGNVFGGGNAAEVDGNTKVVVTGNKTTVKQHVFGGGNAAAVDGNTLVWLKMRAKILGNIYGGGNQGEVGGDTKVIVNGEQ